MPQLQPNSVAGPVPTGLWDLLVSGDEAYDRGDRIAAHSAYREAQRLDGNDPRLLSRLGLTLTLVARDELKGVAFCEEAIRRGGEDPDALWRLSVVYLATFQKDRAVRAMRRGLQIAPDHAKLLAAIDRLGIRRTPVIRFLSRSNPINRLLGRIRHRLAPPRELNEE